MTGIRGELSDRPTSYATRARLLVCVLGGFGLICDGKPLHVSEKAAALLAVLGRRADAPVSRESLLAALWPDQDPRLAAGSLSTLLWSLHRRLAPVFGSAQVVVQTHGGYVLNRAAGVVVDAALFDELICAGEAQAARGSWQSAAELYWQAVSLYRGDLYIRDGFDVDLVIERERLRGRLQTVLADLAQRSFEQGEMVAAMQAAQRLLATDPFREDMHRLLMRCYVRTGQRSRAFQQYRLCRTLLQREFDADPEPATNELFDEIRARRSSGVRTLNEC